MFLSYGGRFMKSSKEEYKMDVRKVTLVATIAVIALVAIGIGYAYTASTENSGNTVKSEYLTLVQGGDGAYTFTTSDSNKVEWNTADAKNPASTGDSDYAKTTFTLSGTSTTIATGYSLVQIGKDFTILTQSTNPTVVDQTCTIEAATGINTTLGGNPNAAAIFMKVVCNGVSTLFKYDSTDSLFKVWTAGNPETLGTNTFTISATAAGTGFNPVTVSVYYGYATANAGIVVTHAKATHPTISEQPLNNAKLTYSISNVAKAVSLQSIALQNGEGASVASISVANGSQSSAYTIVFTPSTATVKTFTAEIASEATATVQVTDNTVKVTGVAVGTTTLTITPTDTDASPIEISIEVTA